MTEGLYYDSEAPDGALASHPNGWCEGCSHEPEPLASGLTAGQAAEALMRQGYGRGEAETAVAQAMRQSSGVLYRHAVWMDSGGKFSIRPGNPLPPGALPPAPGLERAWMMNGHELAREQIRRHGRDRYPTPGAQYSKILGEMGELGEALIEFAASLPPHIHDDDGTVEGCPGCFPDDRKVIAEYANVGLALFALGNKLGLNLIQCMRELVAGDKRKFT